MRSSFVRGRSARQASYGSDGIESALIGKIDAERKPAREKEQIAAKKRATKLEQKRVEEQKAKKAEKRAQKKAEIAAAKLAAMSSAERLKLMAGRLSQVWNPPTTKRRRRG
jgi:hypothetical protein